MSIETLVVNSNAFVEETATREFVYSRMEGHVLQKATLSGNYQRWHKE